MRAQLKLVSLATLLALSGCSRCSGPSAPAPDAAVVVPAAPTVATGVVEGRVILAEGATLPLYPPEMMMRALSDVPVEACSPPKTTDRQPVQLAEDGRGLIGVLVTAAEFRAVVPKTARTHEVHIQDCRLTPMFIDATEGDTLRLINDSPYPFIPSLPAVQGVAAALIRTQKRDVPLSEAGLRTISCATFGANCGRLDVITMYHPVHTRSAAAGRFRLENVPANEDVTINAWHPLFRSGSARARVRAGETLQVEIVLTPDTIQIAPPPPVPPHPLQPGEEFLQ